MIHYNSPDKAKSYVQQQKKNHERMHWRKRMYFFSITSAMYRSIGKKIPEDKIFKKQTNKW